MDRIRNTTEDAMDLPGYYYNDHWMSLKCQTLPYSDVILKCLRNKTLYFLGDSTIRQWFVFLIEQVEKLKLRYVIENDVAFRLGRDSWTNQIYNLSLHYHHHGFPNRISWVPTTDMKYVANMLNSLSVHDANTAIFISTVAHFTITSLSFYRNRLRTIKSAIQRLHERSPQTPVIFKSANTRMPLSVDQSNWYHNELNTVLHEEMSNMPNVVVVDVWNMTTGHYSGWKIHPLDPVVKSEIVLAMSFICPYDNEKSEH